MPWNDELEVEPALVEWSQRPGLSVRERLVLLFLSHHASAYSTRLGVSVDRLEVGCGLSEHVAGAILRRLEKRRILALDISAGRVVGVSWGPEIRQLVVHRKETEQADFEARRAQRLAKAAAKQRAQESLS